jgi:FMN phosphatase YigB (HAD superfamily)
MKIEAFIFDIGNVLLSFDYGRAHRALAAKGARDPDPQAMKELSSRYERGQVECGAFLEAFSALCGGGVPHADLAAAWNDIFTPIAPMWDVVVRLHAEGYPLFLLSNTNRLQHEDIVRRHRIFGYFREGVFSYRAGMMKPDPGIYELAIRQCGVRPQAALYIDDVAAYAEAGRSAGLQAWRYDAGAHGEFLAALRDRGVHCV